MSKLTTYHGKCHCGEVEWTAELTEGQKGHLLCHCNTCKVLTSGPYSINSMIPRSAFKITKGELKAYSYKGYSGKDCQCYFCPTCSAHAYHHLDIMGPDLIILRKMLLDGGRDAKPVMEAYADQRLEWLSEVAPSYESLGGQWAEESKAPAKAVL